MYNKFCKYNKINEFHLFYIAEINRKNNLRCSFSLWLLLKFETFHMVSSKLNLKTFHLATSWSYFSAINFQSTVKFKPKIYQGKVYLIAYSIHFYFKYLLYFWFYLSEKFNLNKLNNLSFAIKHAKAPNNNKITTTTREHETKNWEKEIKFRL